MSDLINKELLNFDPLDTAEKIMGKEYNNDEATSGLGMLLHLAHSENKKTRLKQDCDTYYSQEAKYYIQIVEELGFIKAYEESFVTL